jgi:hypothetical protein
MVIISELIMDTTENKEIKIIIKNQEAIVVGLNIEVKTNLINF